VRIIATIAYLVLEFRGYGFVGTEVDKCFCINGSVLFQCPVIFTRLEFYPVNSTRVNVEKERLYPVKSWTRLPSNACNLIGPIDFFVYY